MNRPCIKFAMPFIAIWMVIPLGVSVAQQASSGSATRGDVVCGPRCIRFLLQYYEIEDPPLPELIHEIQWPDIRQGATLAALQEALNKRGIHTYPLEVSDVPLIDWPHPVLITLKLTRPDGQRNDIDHYVVWLPTSSKSDTHIWAGMRGVNGGPYDRLAEKMTGALMLTSPTPISDADAARAIRKYGVVSSTMAFFEQHATRLLPLISLVLVAILVRQFRNAPNRQKDAPKPPRQEQVPTEVGG